MKSSKQKKVSLRTRRVFSEQIRRQTVKDIETGKCTVLEASRELQVSDKTIYRWLYLYSRYLVKNQVLVVEHKSESYRSKELEQRIKELEAALGRKQLEIELLNKVIEMAGKEYKTDLKKNLSNKRSSGTGFKKGSGTDTR